MILPNGYKWRDCKYVNTGWPSKLMHVLWVYTINSGSVDFMYYMGLHHVALSQKKKKKKKKRLIYPYKFGMIFFK